MKIENLRSEKDGNRVRAVATVKWEDSDRSTYELYFETDETFADGLSCNPHAFLVGSIIPALHYGEERVFIDAEICPTLRDGLLTVMNWFRLWYYKPDQRLVRIEARTSSGVRKLSTPQRAGFFFSGGVDSFATLRKNRLDFPISHPWSIKDALLVYGLELDSPLAFQYVLDSLSKVAYKSNISLIPVYTNVYLNYREEDAKDHFSLWLWQFQAAALASIAHAFHRRFDKVYIAADASISTLALRNIQQPHPWGTHPLIDYNYSSSDFLIRHDGLTLSRFDKIKMLADWDPALQHLRVCNMYKLYKTETLNCLKCDKCLRTMLALLAMGKLKHTRAFNMDDITLDHFRSKFKPQKTTYHFYQELIQPLTERGRQDLVKSIKNASTKIRLAKIKVLIKNKILMFTDKYTKLNLRQLKKLYRKRSFSY